MYVIVAGGGKIGYNLARTLLAAGHEVLVVEKDPGHVRWLEDRLGQVVLWGDATEVRVLERAGAGRADVAAAVTGLDEDNIMICRLAERVFKCSRVIGRVNNPQNEEAFRLLGLTYLINSTKLIYQLVEQEIDTAGLIPILTAAGGSLEFVQEVLPATAPAVSRAVKDLRLPERSVLVAVLRGQDMIFPRGDLILEGGDTIIAAAASEAVPALRAALLSG
ncbi:MAG: TrkA family potassium uptake protein [Clostridia bacterium]|nr:MAG: TrkA family potassium uptake protein [Clostridia bacterium]